MRAEADNRQSACTLRYAKLTSSRHRRGAYTLALEELLIRKCQRLDLMQFRS
jgi:hypothetical protein